MITEKPIRKMKKLIGLPRDEVLRLRDIVRHGGGMPKIKLEQELARFQRIQKYANYF